MIANQLNVVDWLVAQSLRRLTNKLVCTKFANTDYNKEFTKSFAVGETVRVNFPQRFAATDGMTFQPQPINRRNTTVTVDQPFGVHLEWDSITEALRLERGRDKIQAEYFDPAMDEIAQQIDSRFALFAYQNTPNIVGVLGTDPNTTTTHMQARQRLIELGCPAGKEKGYIIPPSVSTSLVPALQSVFNPTDALSKQYREGSLGRLGGFDWYESMSLYSHTSGVLANFTSATLGSAAVDGATSLTITCTTGDTFKKGDVITVANVFAANPQTRRQTTSGTTKQFVITADATAVASSATVNIYPTIYGPSNQYQNVTALPASGAAVTMFPGTTFTAGTAKSGINGLAIHPDAFALVGVKLMMPEAAEISVQKRDPNSGISVALVQMFDPIERRMVTRFDVLLGFGVLYGENCCVRVLCA